MWQKIYRTIQPQAFGILVLFHLVGLVGIGFIDIDLFAGLSALNLLLSIFLLYIDHEGVSKELWRFFGLVFILGYLAELIGITTGFPFGDYHYLENLGPKLFGVPLVIGVNWILLTMSSGYVAQQIFEKRWARMLGAATLMVMVDFFIEPVADELHFWKWEAEYVPALNYLGWFVISLIAQSVFQNTVSNHINKLAVKYFFVVFGFFVVLNIVI